MEIEMVKDYSDALQLLHYVAIDGSIIWPERRKGERIEKNDGSSPSPGLP